jgi:hypothetical protein
MSSELLPVRDVSNCEEGNVQRNFSWLADPEPLAADSPHNPQRNEGDARFNANAYDSVQHLNPHFKSTAFPRGMRLYRFHITAASYGLQNGLRKLFVLNGELGGSRTHDPRLKRALLYQLSYELPLGHYIQIITGRGLTPRQLPGVLPLA